MLPALLKATLCDQVNASLAAVSNASLSDDGSECASCTASPIDDEARSISCGLSPAGGRIDAEKLRLKQQTKDSYPKSGSQFISHCLDGTRGRGFFPQAAAMIAAVEARSALAALKPSKAIKIQACTC